MNPVADGLMPQFSTVRDAAQYGEFRVNSPIMAQVEQKARRKSFARTLLPDSKPSFPQRNSGIVFEIHLSRGSFSTNALTAR